MQESSTSYDWNFVIDSVAREVCFFEPIFVYQSRESSDRYPIKDCRNILPGTALRSVCKLNSNVNSYRMVIDRFIENVYEICIRNFFSFDLSKLVIKTYSANECGRMIAGISEIRSNIDSTASLYSTARRIMKLIYDTPLIFLVWYDYKYAWVFTGNTPNDTISKFQEAVIRNNCDRNIIPDDNLIVKLSYESMIQMVEALRFENQHARIMV